jgi:hypothetical protein
MKREETTMAVSTPEKKQKKEPVSLTWLQCQIPHSDWDVLNELRTKLGLKWADVIIPATKEYIAKLDGKATDASTEAPANATIQNKADEQKGARKTKRPKKVSATDNSKNK